MASVTSLGEHKPSALSWLIAEGILPEDPAKETYDWQTWAAFDHFSTSTEEELLRTDNCVVWSRAGFIQRVFHFDIEDGPVKHAIFAHFPDAVSLLQKGRNSNGWSQHNRDKSPISPTSRKAPTDDAHISDEFEHASKLPQLSDEYDKLASDDRALVIILGTQAQIFFLSGTSQIIHLPFEVDTVHPLPKGILLQRRLPDHRLNPSTPALPPAPQNTFALSQSSVSKVSEPAPTQWEGPAALLSNLLQEVRVDADLRSDGKIPRVYCLMDPLSEIGTVVGRKGVKAQQSSTLSRSKISPFYSLDPRERIVFVSAYNELRHASFAQHSKEPLILAVTAHELSGKISLWVVQFLDQSNSSNAKGRKKRGSESMSSRRNSSHGRGTSTGAVTPMIRNSTTAKDTVGASQSYRGKSQDYKYDDVVTDQNTTDALDLAFGDSTKLAKSSRRVSSLLARSDLAASNDRTTIREFVGTQPVQGSRRGPSFGPQGTRLSSDPDWFLKPRNSQRLSGIRSSLDSVSLLDEPGKGMGDGLEDMHRREGQNASEALLSSSKMRKDVSFHRIHLSRDPFFGVAGDGLQIGNLEPRAFTIALPRASLQSSTHRETIHFVLVNRETQELLSLKICPHEERDRKRTRSDQKMTSKTWTEGVIVDETRQSAVIDACKVKDGNITRILTLVRHPNGASALSLQAPWAAPLDINLPKPINMIDPFTFGSERVGKRHHEGFRRVLSQGIDQLDALEHPDESGAVDIVDSDKVLHRIRLQLRPHDHLVARILGICDGVLPSLEYIHEPILQVWLGVRLWLQEKSEADNASEWLAVTIALFILAAPFIPDRRSDFTKQQNKRRSGLARFAGGAHSSMENWEKMLSKENDMNNTTPKWMIGAWDWMMMDQAEPFHPRTLRFQASPPSRYSAQRNPGKRKSKHIVRCISLAQDFTRSPGGQNAVGSHGYLPITPIWTAQTRQTALASILISLHLLREELKLDVLAETDLHRLTPILAQIGNWLGWPNWGFQPSSYFTLQNLSLDDWLFDNSVITGVDVPSEPFSPPSIMNFIETSFKDPHADFISLLDVASLSSTHTEMRVAHTFRQEMLLKVVPRTLLVSSLLSPHTEKTMETLVSKTASWGLTPVLMETFPESIAACFRTALLSCQSHPRLDWHAQLLSQIGRDDLVSLKDDDDDPISHFRSQGTTTHKSSHDVHSICHTALEVEALGPYDGSAELDRQAITRLLFKDDQRFAEAAKLVHPLLYPVAKCVAEPEWSDTDLLEAQQELAKTVAIRTLSVSLGRGLVFYNARLPLLTEKFPIHGFTLSCVMKPADTTVTADRAVYTEEKVSWAFFHAGVEAGLSISQQAPGVNTSWVLFNKARDLNNRHAGFLLAMGLNGHLKSIAKWLAFKYLTPKHSVTSVGLLLGLSISHLGSMDTLITRLLSVHVTRMLPPGAAELNLSPLTQTSAMMGIGLLYCQTQHRRMSEIMVSEMENVEEEGSATPQERLRDEGYRLAAGFSLGFINLGKGKDLKGLHDMNVTKRLLAIAVAPKETDHVHILDRATAGATVAIALMFMKTQDEALARKIDIPDTVHQFEYVRPDNFLLRTTARHLIMWNDIRATSQWIRQKIYPTYRQKSDLTAIRALTSEDLPFLNTIAGLCFVIGLRHAGSGALEVRSLLLRYLRQFMRICKLSAPSYDSKLARITVRNCQDVVALSAACVMAGTGDLQIFRCLRSLHGRTDIDTPYGSHLATHFAIGVLFLSGGTHTFGTSDIAIASLLCAFYPLFPNSVLDNKSHLQAFRHFWVLAVESRCLVLREVESRRPVSLSVLIKLKSGDEMKMLAPCLLPELDTISKITTLDPQFWEVILDLEGNPEQYKKFKQHQNIFVHRRTPYDAHGSAFSGTMQALNDAQFAERVTRQNLTWIFTLPAFSMFDQVSQAIALPPDPRSAMYRGTRTTALDDQLMLEKVCVPSDKSEKLWNLRLLFAWVKSMKSSGEKSRWVADEFVERLEAALVLRRRKGRLLSS